MPGKPEPGRDQGMAQRTETLNIVFLLSSIALLLIFSLMIWVDYDREWKATQADFNSRDVKLTEDQRKAAIAKIGTVREKGLDEDLRKGEEEVRANRKALQEAQGRLNKANGDYYRLDQNYRFAKA